MRRHIKCRRAISNCGMLILKKLKYIVNDSDWETRLWTSIFLIFIAIFCAEFLVYYIVLSFCKWPTIESSNEQPVRAMILSDTHVLGPIHGYLMDKVRKEWQMHRAYRTSVTIFSPDVAFILGDLFDEGDFVDTTYFEEYADRFSRIFYTPETTKRICAVGNHDIGFHYRLHRYFVDRFEQRFNNTVVELYTIRDVHFVVVNSMAMQGDNCAFCVEGYERLTNVSNALNCAKSGENCPIDDIAENIKYSRPILLQHFPTYRASDKECLAHDTSFFEEFKENWEVLSKNSTKVLGDKLYPRVAFSGHSHDYCLINNTLGIEEYTAASYNHRNKRRPSFLLATFTPTQYAVNLCYLPTELHIFSYYIISIIIILILVAKGIIRERQGVCVQYSYSRLHTDNNVDEAEGEYSFVVG